MKHGMSLPLSAPLNGARAQVSTSRGPPPCSGRAGKTRLLVVVPFAVAALSERWNPLRIQDWRSETAATRIKPTHYLAF
jgi:hypothetical protein